MKMEIPEMDIGNHRAPSAPSAPSTLWFFCLMVAGVNKVNEVNLVPSIARDSEAPPAPDQAVPLVRSTYQLGLIRPIGPTHGARHPELELGDPRGRPRLA
jgi:hypothetical protein